MKLKKTMNYELGQYLSTKEFNKLYKDFLNSTDSWENLVILLSLLGIKYTGRSLILPWHNSNPFYFSILINIMSKLASRNVFGMYNEQDQYWSINER